MVGGGTSIMEGRDFSLFREFFVQDLCYLTSYLT